MSFDPTPEAKDLFATLDKRWQALFAWGVEAKMPGQKLSIADWKAYRAAWLAQQEEYEPPDMPGSTLSVLPSIGAESNQLASVERDATSKGYATQGAIPGSNIDVTQTSESTRTAAEIDAAAKAAEEAAKKAAEAPASVWAAIPWYWKVGGAAVGVAIVVGAVRR